MEGEEGESRALGYHLQQMRGADERGHPVLVIAEGSGNKSGDELTFEGSCVRYACHLDCWDGAEENE